MFTEPKLVLAALDRALELHPYGRTGTIARTARADSDTALLWNMLLSLAPEEQGAVIAQLTRREEQLLLYGAGSRLSDPRCLHILGLVFELREPGDGAAIAWEAFLLSNGWQPFRRAATAHVEANPSRTLWPSLLAGTDPLLKAARALGSAGATLHTWAASQPVGLADIPRVVRHLKRVLLSTEFRRQSLVREGDSVVRRWLGEVLLDSEQVGWLQAYLGETHAAGWPVENEILAAVVQRFQNPDPSLPFWSALPADVLAAVEHWIKDRDLTVLLGEEERVVFWRRFLTEMKFAKASREGGAVFLCFATWFAVQFKESGRATYMLRNHQLKDLAACGDDDRLYSTVLARRSRHALGSYEHRGYTWEIRAASEVRRVMHEQLRGPDR